MRDDCLVKGLSALAFLLGVSAVLWAFGDSVVLGTVLAVAAFVLSYLLWPTSERRRLSASSSGDATHALADEETALALADPSRPLAEIRKEVAGRHGGPWVCPMCHGLIADSGEPCPSCSYDPNRMLRAFDAMTEERRRSVTEETRPSGD